MTKQYRVLLLWLSQMLVLLIWGILLFWEAKNPIANKELGLEETTGIGELFDTEIITIIKKRRGI